MKKLKIATTLAAIFLLLCISPVKAETLEIPGTGAVEILLTKLAVEFNTLNQGNRVVVPPSVGSSGGIRLVGEGDDILGRVARPLKEDEKKYGLTYLVFAKDPVLFALNRKIGIQGLTRDQLINVFSGKVNNWQELGGKDYPVRLLVREPDDSSFLIIKEHISAFQKINFPERSKFLYHDNEMMEMLQKYSTVIGWLTGSSLNTISQDVIGLALDGVEPTAENIINGSYPLSGDYALVFKEEKLTPLARNFIDFLSSKEAVQILQAEGVIPVGTR